jgi:hypothetical protein
MSMAVSVLVAAWVDSAFRKVPRKAQRRTEGGRDVDAEFDFTLVGVERMGRVFAPRGACPASRGG